MSNKKKNTTTTLAEDQAEQNVPVEEIEQETPTEETAAPTEDQTEQETPTEETAAPTEDQTEQETPADDTADSENPSEDPTEDQAEQDVPIEETPCPFEATVSVALAVLRKTIGPGTADMLKPVATLKQGSKVTVTDICNGNARLANGLWIALEYITK